MPFGFPDNPFNSPFGQAPARVSSGLAPLMPQEEEGILSRLGGGALGGLGYIGGTLDKAFGGRAIRGLLGGRPEELASLIPFSDKLGITNEDNAVSGKELLGFDKHDDSWGGFLGGIGAEMLLDPGTYLTFGGKTALGQAAAKANALPKVVQPITREAGGLMSGLKKVGNLFNPAASADIDGTLAAQMRGVGASTPEAASIAARTGQTAADVADKPLAALATLQLPFTDAPFASLGTGEGAQRLADKFSSLKDWAAYNPVGRAVTPLFDNRLSKFGPSPETEIGQRTVRKAADEFATATPGIVGKFIDQRGLGESLGMMDPVRAPAANRELTGLLEGTIKNSSLPEFNAPEVMQMVADIKAELAAARPVAANEGRAAANWKSEHGVEYAPRQLTPAGEAAVGQAGSANRRALNPFNANDMARIPELDLPGGTNAINDLFLDPAAMLAPATGAGVGNTMNKASRNIRGTYLGWNRPQEAQYLQMARDARKGLIPETILDPATGNMIANPAYEHYQKLTSQRQQSRSLAHMASSGTADEFAAGVPWQDILAKKKIPFANNPLGEVDAYRKADKFSNTAAKGFRDIVSASAQAPGADTIDLLSVLDKSKYNNPNMKDLLVAQLKTQGLLGPKAQWKELSSVHLPAAVADDVMRFGQSFAKPRELNPILDAFDSVTNLTKASQTTTLPFTVPTLARNALTEGFVNALGGAPLNSWATGVGLRSGNAVESLTRIPAFKGMTADAATKKFHELAFQFGISQPADRMAAAELVGRGAHTSDVGAGVLAPLGGKKKTALESIKGAVPTSLNEANPLNIRGVFGKTETTFAPTRSAQELMHNVDETGRIAAFAGYLEQGFDPAVAAQKAKTMRMDPDKLTGFEKQWMKRLVPYYSWLRTSVPGMLGEVAQKPGGAVGASIRGTNEVRQKDGLIPDYVGEGLALPIGGRQDDGTQRYLSGLGLPFEELNRIASNGPTPIATTLQRLMGNLNPMLKLPIEAATNTQLYSGRHLDDLFPRLGSTAADQLIGNSPLGTIARAGSRLADERKGVSGNLMSLFSPARITDADMNRAAQVQGRKLLEEQLRANPAVRSFERLYVPPEMAGTMSPEDLQMLRLYQTLLQRAQAQNAANPR